MQTLASPLPFLTTAAPGGKPAAHQPGSQVHKATRPGAEAKPSNAQADGADMPEQASSFSRLLRDQAAQTRTEEASAETRTERKSDAGAQPGEQGAAVEASQGLSGLLASLMQGQGPAQAGPGVKAGQPGANATNTEALEDAATGGPGRGKGRPQRNAALSLDKTAAAEGQVTKAATSSSNRELVPAGAAARAALGGVGTGSASPLTVSEASAQLKSALQRAPSSETGAASATGSITASANSGQLNMTLNSLLPGAASSISAAAASAAVDTALPQDVRRPEFVPAFSARVATLVQEGVEHARVHLNPVDMGPVSLQLSLDGQQVRVDMTAEVAATRLVLEQALPTLAGALREAGFTLSGGGVSQPVSETANLGGQSPRDAGGSSGEPPPQTSGSSTGPAGQQAEGRRAPEGEQAPNQGSRSFTATGGLATEIHLDADGRPHLPQGRGLVDTFA